MGGTALHARRLAPEPEGPPPADDEEAAVRTFVEAQMFLRDLFHTMRKTLQLPGAPGGPQRAPLGLAAPAPVDQVGAPIPFPSFSDLMSTPGGPQAASEGGEGAILATPSALAAAAARLYAFFLVNCFGRALPESVKLRISRGLNAPAAASLRITREDYDGSLRAEWALHIHPDIQQLPLLGKPVAAAKGLVRICCSSCGHFDLGAAAFPGLLTQPLQPLVASSVCMHAPKMLSSLMALDTPVCARMENRAECFRMWAGVLEAPEIFSWLSLVFSRELLAL